MSFFCMMLLTSCYNYFQVLLEVSKFIIGSFVFPLLPPLCSGSSATATLFEGHQLSLEYLVRNLLKLYVDIEFTGSHTQVCYISRLSW